MVATSTNNRLANFLIWNVTEDREAEFRFQGNGAWQPGNFIDIQETIDDTLREIWRMTMSNPGGGVAPTEVDTFLLVTKKPFSTGDIFEFTTKKASVNQTAVKAGLDKIAVVPNPYIAAASWERRNFQQSGRGERKVYFIHLPQKAKIRIFTIAGHLVDVIEHDSTVDDDFAGFEGAHPWDMRTREGLDIAFGIYVYYIEVEGVGQKVGKFAVIK